MKCLCSKKIFFKLLEPERYFLLSGTGSIPGIFVSLEKFSEKIEKKRVCYFDSILENYDGREYFTKNLTGGVKMF